MPAVGRSSILTAGPLRRNAEQANSFAELREVIDEELASLVWEVETVERELAEPGTHTSPPVWYSHTLFGLVMGTFARVDLLSRFRYGGKGADTQNMVAFLVDYLGHEPRAAFVAVEMWRHSLMHSGAPAVLVYDDGHGGDIEVKWFLVWRSLPTREHFQVDRNLRVLNSSLHDLTHDLRRGAQKLFSEFATSPDAQRQVMRRLRGISRRRVSERW